MIVMRTIDVRKVWLSVARILGFTGPDKVLRSWVFFVVLSALLFYAGTISSGFYLGATLCDAMRCGAMRCDASPCNTLPCNATPCHAVP